MVKRMIEILQSKNAATRFQILVEVAASGPNVHQRAIAEKLGITPQAVSEHFQQLQKEGLLLATNRSNYRVSATGVNWVLRMLRELNDYVSLAEKAVTNITVCAAIAESDLAEGQKVGLTMKEGLLFAVPRPGGGATGIAMSSARQGEDIDVSNIEGVIDLPRGNVTILQVPAIQRGGSRHTDLKRLEREVKLIRSRKTGAIGLEALIALRRIAVEPDYFYGVAEAVIEATRCGLPFLVVCSADAVPGLVKRLQDEKVEYREADISRQAE